MHLALVFLAVLTAVAPAFGQVLTLDEARRGALEQQPALKALELARGAGQLGAQADAALPDPRLKLGALNFPARGFPDSRDDMTQVGISWEQMIPGGDKRRLRSERALAEAELAAAEAAVLRQSIRRDVALAWLDAWLAAANERLYGELAAAQALSVESARSALGTGKASQADLLLARQALGQIADRRLELAAQASRARAGISRWVQGASMRPLPQDLPDLGDPPPPEALLAQLAAHPQLGLILGQKALADTEVALAREATRSDRTVELGYYARSGGRSDMLMFQIAFELPIFSARKQDNTLAAKLRLADKVREQHADQLRLLRAESESAREDWRLAGERLHNLRATILPDATARLQALVAQYGAGGAGLGSVLEARRAVIESRMQEQGLRAAQARARIALQYFETSGERK
jgi:cobalt-zinc-cadmium efflux system outer membrane protein